MKPKYESTNTTAVKGYKVEIIPCEIDGITYTIPAPVAKYIDSLQTDRDKFVEYRQMTADEMAQFVDDRVRAIVDALNGNLPRYNLPGTVYLSKKIDAQDFDRMNALCELLKNVVFDTAKKAPGTDIHADGLTRG